MKYIIIPCVGSEVYYKIQTKNILMWFNLKNHLGEVIKYSAVKACVEHMEESEPPKYKHVNFEPV